MAKTFKRYIPLIVWLLVLSAMIASVAFTTVKQQDVLCSRIEVNMIDNGHYFIEQSDVLNLIMEKAKQPVGKPLNVINTAVLENCINANPFVADAQIYLTIDGIMHVKVIQRNPIVRFMMSDGESFYVDENGVTMPLCEKYTAPVVIANGNLSGNISKLIFSETVFTAGDTANKSRTAGQVYAIAKYIQNDTVLNPLIEQIYINNENEIELVPRIGDQIILFGDAGNLENKFSKLLTFYRKGLNKIGWTNYSKINLKYENQVVVMKKGNAAVVNENQKVVENVSDTINAITPQ